MKNTRKKFDLKSIIFTHIYNNKKEYIIVLLFFIIGLLLGVFFINNMQEESFNNVSNYLNTFIEKFKGIESIDYINLLKNSLVQNIILVLILWFFGTTVIGIPVVFGVIGYRGFCLGYTISSCICALGTTKGLVFVLCNLLLQNLIFIPAILAISVSGFKLYKSIVKDKRRENIKIEIIRHTVFCGLMTIIIAISSVVEVFASNNILKGIIKYM